MAEERRTALPDGTPVLLRPLHRTDRAAFVAAFDRLSEETRYTRFMTPVQRLTNAEVDYFLDIDHRTHEALVALHGETGEQLGLGRYVSTPEVPEEAELAFTIADAWQGRGVGGVLLDALADLARERGITRLTADVLAENLPMRRLFARLPGATWSASEAGVVRGVAAL
jgi:RimJ/RimL family protein N-acetyltransferase